MVDAGMLPNDCSFLKVINHLVRTRMWNLARPRLYPTSPLWEYRAKLLARGDDFTNEETETEKA